MPQRSKPRVVVPPALPRESAAESWLRGIRLSGFSILVLALVVLSIVVLAPSLRMLIEQRQEIAQLEASLEQQRQTVEDLQEQRARWDDPAYIKAQARDRLFYVMPGEYPYLIIDDVAAGEAVDPEPASTGIEETKVDWASSLLSSYFAAGLSDAPVGGQG
ncbi:septum formation initiator family protein [Naasia sp. SYSU D00057]|uniref:FtsB family cell division protein n=1 Tax=Naasia sp. SYSU D00057 TaxID=2817380 RepID=UPI001B3148BE|nr:septum formation initiator family protein [Naasia sp. SYSU D00057]